MRAIVIPKHGPPEVFEEREVRGPPALAPGRPHPGRGRGRQLRRPDGPRGPLPRRAAAALRARLRGLGRRRGGRARRPTPRSSPGTRVVAVTRFWGYAERVAVPIVGRHAHPRRRSPSPTAAAAARQLPDGVPRARSTSATRGRASASSSTGARGAWASPCSTSRAADSASSSTRPRAATRSAASSSRRGVVKAVEHYRDRGRLRDASCVARYAGGAST